MGRGRAWVDENHERERKGDVDVTESSTRGRTRNGLLAGDSVLDPSKNRPADNNYIIIQILFAPSGRQCSSFKNLGCSKPSLVDSSQLNYILYPIHFSSTIYIHINLTN
jgi:hypothetical protein